jgi:hypothetical protein
MTRVVRLDEKWGELVCGYRRSWERGNGVTVITSHQLTIKTVVLIVENVPFRDYFGSVPRCWCYDNDLVNSAAPVMQFSCLNRNSFFKSRIACIITNSHTHNAKLIHLESDVERDSKMSMECTAVFIRSLIAG